MSYLDKNPFNRPTPTFNSNANSFNTYSTYSTYDYLSDKKPYSYSFGHQSDNKHFSSNTHSPQYKYSRAIQDSPFITGNNPFTTSTANFVYNKNSSLNYFSSNPYQRDSYESKKQYNYSPSISNASGFTDPYQQSYFKTDKFEDKFKKSNFQQDIELHLEKSRENQTDLKYHAYNKQPQISKLLQNNPFQKTSLQSNKNIYDPYPTSQSSQYTKNLHTSYLPQTQYQYNHTSYSNKFQQKNFEKEAQQKFQSLEEQHQYRNNSQDKYAHLVYKPNSLALSDVKKIQSFGELSETQLQFESIKYLQNQKYERYSQKGSRNTFINKISDLISSDNDQKNPQFKSEYQDRQKKSLENPFSKSNNPFAKTSLISKQSQQSKTQISGKKLSISSQNSIKFDDFMDIETKNKKSLKMQSSGKYSKQLLKRNQDKLFESQDSKKSYEEKVDEQFQKWGYESGNKSLSIFESRRSEKDQSDKFFKESKRNSNELFGSLRQKQKENQQYCPQNSRKNIMVRKGEVRDKFYFEEQNRKGEEEKDFSKKGSLKIELGMRESLRENGQIEKGLNKKQEIFRFSKQVFEDQDDEEDSIVEQYHDRKKIFNNSEEDIGLRRISEVDFSQQRESQRNYSKKESRASQSQAINVKKQQISQQQRQKLSHKQKQQINTEQKIDQKLSKYKYHYQKPLQPSFSQQKQQSKNSPQSILNNPPSHQSINNKEIILEKAKPTQNHFKDFIDLNVEDSNDSFMEQSSFQAVHPNFNNQQITQTTSKRVNLKQRVINNLKNDSLTSQKIVQHLISKNQPVISSQKNPQFMLGSQKNPQFMLNIKEKDDNEKKQQEKYEFQSLDEFEGKYKYNMKESGFDFQEDQFQETQRNLGLYDQEPQNITNYDKILVPQFGYEDNDYIKKTLSFKTEEIKINEKQNLTKQLPLRRYISSISSNNEEVLPKRDMKNEEEFLPSFNVKQSQRIERLSKGESNNVVGIGSKEIKRVNKYTQQSIIPQYKQDRKIKQFQYERKIGINTENKQVKKEYNGVKVQKVKIYESENQSEGYRSSGQSNQKEYNLNIEQSQKFKHKIYSSQASQMQQSQTQQYYKSPFQQKLQKPSTTPTNNKTKNNNFIVYPHQNQTLKQTNNPLQSKYPSQQIYNPIEKSFQPQISYQENLKQTLRYSDKHQRDYSPTLNSLRQSHKSSKQAPVRDSFDFSNPARNSLDFSHPNKDSVSFSKGTLQRELNMKKNKQFTNKYPTMLQHKGNIYHLIQFLD